MVRYAKASARSERTFDAYLEPHIEQAPVLDRENCDIGHAGGTPMAMRRNALVGAGYVVAAVNEIGLSYAADEGRTTTTRIESFPNLPGTYAGQVKFTIDFRHIDAGRFAAMRKEVDAAIAASLPEDMTRA